MNYKNKSLIKGSYESDKSDPSDRSDPSYPSDVSDSVT